MNSQIHPANLSDEDLLTFCDLQRLRRSGPGGQHRNKVETAVLIIHSPSGIRAEANERRSQEQNKSEAMKRLKVKLACRIRTFRAPELVPSSLWDRHCSSGKLSISLKNTDYPALLAEALDIVYQESLDLKIAASQLHCSMSQLVKFLKKTPPAWTKLNQDRKEKGLHPYH